MKIVRERYISKETVRYEGRAESQLREIHGDRSICFINPVARVVRLLSASSYSSPSSFLLVSLAIGIKRHNEVVHTDHKQEQGKKVNKQAKVGEAGEIMDQRGVSQAERPLR